MKEHDCMIGASGEYLSEQWIIKDSDIALELLKIENQGIPFKELCESDNFLLYNFCPICGKRIDHVDLERRYEGIKLSCND